MISLLVRTSENCYWLYLFCILLFVVVLSGEPKQNQGRGFVRPPSYFIAGCPKAALLFWFFGDFRCVVLLFIIICITYIKIEKGKNSC